MVAKVGSAGPAVDSVISYAGAAAKADNSRAENSKAKETSEDQKARPMSMLASDRVIKSSEIVGDAARISKTKTTAKPVQGTKEAENAVESEENKAAQDMELSKEAVKITVDEVNERLKPTGSSIEFNYHEKTGRYSFKVLDEETGEVIREVPPEKSLDMVAKMFEMVGILVDKKL